MASIRRNGINYSGGGANYKEVTLAEYEALGDKVNSDNTLYFIKDSSEGGSGGSNMRYNPETDMVEIYFNGEWVVWKTTHFQKHYLYRDGEQIVALSNNTYHGGPNYPSRVNMTFNENSIDGAMTAQTGVMLIGTADLFDLTGYSKIVVECTHLGQPKTYECAINNLGKNNISIGIHYISGSGYMFRIDVISSGTDISKNVVAVQQQPWSFANGANSLSISAIWVE